ncbi:MAG: mutT family protein [Microgenomates group bacterium GW2011_GWC1_39_7]|nr:MAG: mutT family protein [Microgenomates group bacterium GW2011_GWC1_39_7]
MDIKKLKDQYKFCFSCASKLESKKGKVLICTNCGKNTYVDPSPTNGAIIENEKGEIMLVRRAKDPKKGYWDIPGGFINPGETAEESTIRELKEELGKTKVELEYLGTESDIYEYQGTAYPVLAFVFKAKINTENLYPADDVTQIKFFTPKDLPFDKIAFEGVKRALKKFIEKK